MYNDWFMLSVMKFRIPDYMACLEQLNKSPLIREISTNGTHRQMFRVQRFICICSAISLFGLKTKHVERRFKTTMKYYGDFNLAISLILRRSRTGTVWFYTSTSNKRAARPKLYTESLTRDLKHTYSRLTLVRISINL